MKTGDAHSHTDSVKYTVSFLSLSTYQSSGLVEVASELQFGF